MDFAAPRSTSLTISNFGGTPGLYRCFAVICGTLTDNYQALPRLLDGSFAIRPLPQFR
jgi:hypothetical protein